MKFDKRTRLYLKNGATGKYYAHKAMKDGRVCIALSSNDKVVGYTLYDELINDLKTGPYIDLDAMEL